MCMYACMVYIQYKSWKSFRFLPVPFRCIAVSFLFRFLSFLRITSALAFKVLSRASDRSRRCSLTPRSKGSWLCVAHHNENRTGPVNRSRTGCLCVCVACTASERAGVHYLLVIRHVLFYFQAVLEPFFIRVYPFLVYRFFTVPFRLNGTEQNGNFSMTYILYALSAQFACVYTCTCTIM